MRQNPSFAMTDVAELRRLIDRNPWMTLVSHTDDGLVASHYAVLLDEERDDLTVVGHVGKPDDMIHGLGERELLVVVQGPHGYISPGWYGDGSNVPTWNFVSAHLSGIPEVLSPDENLRVLERLVARFESTAPRPPPDVGAAERPRLHRAARARDGRVPAHADQGGRQAQAEPESPGRGRRHDHHGTERRRPLREPRARRRDAPRAHGDGPRAVTAVGETVGTITSARLVGPGDEMLPDDGPFDVFLEGGRIADIAPAGALPPRGVVLDADGAWLIPGLWDHHVHVMQWALVAQRAPLGHATSAAHAASLMGEAPILDGRRVGTGFRDAFWGDEPTLELLDAATGDTPTYLINADVHSVWLNSAALRREGFEPDATGILREAPGLRDLAPTQRGRSAHR